MDGLGAGETDGIALARSLNDALLLLDDGRARRVAASLHLRVSGTVGVLLVAKDRALLERVEPALDRLSKLGFLLAESARLAALRLAGERDA